MASRLDRIIRSAVVLFVLAFFFRTPAFSCRGEEEAAEGFTLEVVSVAAEGASPRRVYLYHTHTHEAYEPEGENVYRPTERWRTADENFNMIRVGRELADRLREAGIEVAHDTSDYEMPRLSTAYSRSLEGVERAAREGYDLYIDLHRDSYSQGNGPNTVSVEGRDTARLLILIGKGSGSGLDEKPDWERNLAAAQMISDCLNARQEQLCRGVSLKSGRYNQHAAVPSMLIEAGNNKNTLPEALNAMEPLARAICQYFEGAEGP